MSTSRESGGFPTLDGVRKLLERYHNADRECEIDPSLKSVAVEAALYNRLRYPWADIKALYHILIDACLDQYKAEDITEDDDETATLIGKASVDRDEDGTAELSSPRDDTEIFIHGTTSSCEDQSRKEIHALLDAFQTDPPFTIQRLSEILLEPKKQYSKVKKVLHSLRIALMVTSTHLECHPASDEEPSCITASDFSLVNENPSSWYNKNSQCNE